MTTISTPERAATGPPTVEPPPQAARGFRPYRITVDLYNRLIESGAIGAKEPVFLWRGRLVEKMTKGDRHNFASAVLNALLVRAVPAGWFVRPEQPVTIADDGVPEPDFSIVRGRPRDYVGRVVTPGDVALVVEISDSRLAADSGEMVEDYARAAIPVYWVVNIPGRTVDIYTNPSGPREAGGAFFAERRSYRPGDEVPVVLDGREVARIAVADVLP